MLFNEEPDRARFENYLLQQPLIWMDGPANLRHFDRQLETVAGRDVIVLPRCLPADLPWKRQINRCRKKKS